MQERVWSDAKTKNIPQAGLEEAWLPIPHQVLVRGRMLHFVRAWQGFRFPPRRDVCFAVRAFAPPILNFLRIVQAGTSQGGDCTHISLTVGQRFWPY